LGVVDHILDAVWFLAALSVCWPLVSGGAAVSNDLRRGVPSRKSIQEGGKAMIGDGRYTLIYPSGEYRTVRVSTVKKGDLKGAQVLGIREKGNGLHFTGLGFLQRSGKMNFWKRTKANPEFPPKRLELIQKAVDRIVADPEAAGLAYALKENRCFRCGKELTVPASIHKGMGPECAKKNWTRDDQKAAYAWRQGQAKPTAAETKKHDDEWIQQKNLFAQEERKQEEKAFMSDPDFREPYDPKIFQSWGGEFEGGRICRICRVPVSRCSC